MSEAKHKSQRSESRNSPQARFAYPFLHEKRVKRANGKPMAKPRNDVVVLLPKLHTDPAQCANYAFLAGLCMEAANKEPSWGGFPAGGHWPIQDGDAPIKPRAPTPGLAPVDPAVLAERYAWRKGNWIIEATNYTETGPQIAVLQNGQIVPIPAKVVNGIAMYKSGDYGIASLSAYTFQNEKFGVNFGLDGVLFTAEGEAIGGGPRSAEQMFADVAGVGVPAAAPQMPQPGMAPAPAVPQMPQTAPVGVTTVPGQVPAPAAPAAPQMPQPGMAPAPGQAPAAPLPTTPGLAPPPAAPQMPQVAAPAPAGPLPPMPGQ